MDIHIRCSKCGKHLEIDEKGAGMTVSCPDCSASLTVSTSTTTHTCPKCYVAVLVDDILKGETFECSTCHQMFHIPSPDDVTEQKCPFCHITVSVPASIRGRFTQCPNCRQQFLVPGSSLNFQHQEKPVPNPESVPERLDLLTKGSQWENRAERAGGRKEAESQAGRSRINRVGGKIAGIPMLIGFAMQVFGFLLGIPKLGHIGGIVFVSGITIGLVLGVAYFLGLWFANPLKAIAKAAVAVTIFLLIFNQGFRHWVISAFSFNTPQTAEATASSAERPIIRQDQQSANHNIAEIERKRKQAEAESAEKERVVREKAKQEKEKAERERVERENERRNQERMQREADRFRDEYLAKQAREQRAQQVEAERQRSFQSLPPYVQDAYYRVNRMLNNGQLRSAQHVNTYEENVQSDSIDKKAYVVFNFEFVTQGGFIRQTTGWLVFTRNSRTGEWLYRDGLSQIDHTPKW